MIPCICMVEVHTGREKIIPIITRFHFDIILFLNVFQLILSSSIYTCYRVNGKDFFQNVAQKTYYISFEKSVVISFANNLTK